MIGQPMAASGFGALASHFRDRTVVTYDPRGLGRSTRSDGRVDHSPTVQAGDVHAVIEALGAGPVEMFASSGGAVTALALVAAHPGDVVTLVAHEPPLIPVLPDAAAAERARAGVRDAYEARGSNAGMAAFIAMTSWRGEYTDEYFAQPAPDPAAFGMPTGGRRLPRRPAALRPVLGGQQLSPRRRRAGRGADAHRDRRRRGVRGHLHRTRGGGHRRAARPAGDRVPQPPRRLPRRRVRLRRPARGLRARSCATSSTTPDAPDGAPRIRSSRHRQGRFAGATTIGAMRGIRERLDQGVVLGAEGYLFELERRGYVKGGPFVPEVVLDFPEAVRQLHREMLRAGAEVMVAFTYYGHREKLRSIGREDDLEPLNRQRAAPGAGGRVRGRRARRRQHLQHLGLRPGRARELGRDGARDVPRAGPLGGRGGSRPDHLRDARLPGRGADQPRGDPGVRPAVDRHVRLDGAT